MAVVASEGRCYTAVHWRAMIGPPIMETPHGKGAVGRRVNDLDWERVERECNERGWSRLRDVLPASTCTELIAGYDRHDLYRATIDMERFRFGRGQYRYFSNPLPPVVAALRRAFYARLQALANDWSQRLGRSRIYPPTLEQFLARCHAAGQMRPTPLILRYGPGDYNCLHQDLYGAVGFPLQVLVMLSQRGLDYEGGEVILLEQRPRAQSKATAIALERGDGLVFTNRERPARGARGDLRVQMRHGASTLTRGRRFVLGLIFHDAA